MSELGRRKLLTTDTQYSVQSEMTQPVELHQSYQAGNVDQAPPTQGTQDASEDSRESNEEAAGDQHDFTAPWWVDLLFILTGVSVFARTEAFFMQTDLFVSQNLRQQFIIILGVA